MATGAVGPCPLLVRRSEKVEVALPELLAWAGDGDF